MKIALQKFGGWLAGMSRPPVIIETANLPTEEVTELDRLVMAAKEKGNVESGGLRTAPDAMSYTITVDDGSKAFDLQQSDVTMTPEFAALKNWIEGHTSK